jgi:hypothetical protein
MSQTDHTRSRLTQAQLLDYHLIYELAAGPSSGYVERVKDRLAQYDLKVSKAVIYSRAKRILSGKAIIYPSADVNGTPASREGKDQCYAGFWTMLDIAIPAKECRRYIGLSANQMDVVRSRIYHYPMIVCEKDLGRAAKLEKLRELSKRRGGPDIQIVVQDIFEVMRENPSSYNVYDLDLMQHLGERVELEKWAEAIWYSALPGNIVINLTASIGRNITEEVHNYRIGILENALENVGFTIQANSPWSYRDRCTPMRAVRLWLNKRELEEN